jgi:hypothetical protein
MRYFLDTEFNSYEGELISLALVRVDLESLYMVFPKPDAISPWVQENVMPHLEKVPKNVKVNRVTRMGAQLLLEQFFKKDDDIEVVVDWPDDIQYLSNLLLTGPGTMVNIPRIRYQLERIDAWPPSDPDYFKIFGAEPVQHNAWWDAVALRKKYREVFSPDDKMVEL